MQSPGGEERREDRRDGRYFFSQAARATGYCTECGAEETNNPSFINSRLKHRRKKGQKNIPNYIFWSLCFFLTVLTQLICFFLNTTPSLHTHTLKKTKKNKPASSPSTLPGYLGLIGNIRSYLHFKVLMQHFPQSYYHQCEFLTCVLTSRITQSVWTPILPTSNNPLQTRVSRQVSTLTFAGLLHC